MTSFVEKLDAACEANRSLLCVGLDPDPQLMPVGDVFEFNRAIVDATHDLVCAYKPNMAFYEAQGLEGLRALGKTIEHIRKVSPETIIIADAKRGDVGHVSAAYASAMFDQWGVDVVTVHGYMGRDSVEPFLSRDGRGAFVLCRTSNPGAVDFQDMANSENLPLYQRVANTVGGWGFNGSLGLVVGATYPEEMKTIRKICPSLPILIPGVGSQAGDLRQSVLNGTDSSGRRAVINASRSVIYAGSGTDYAKAARRETKRLRTASTTSWNPRAWVGADASSGRHGPAEEGPSVRQFPVGDYAFGATWGWCAWDVDDERCCVDRALSNDYGN